MALLKTFEEFRAYGISFVRLARPSSIVDITEVGSNDYFVIRFKTSASGEKQFAVIPYAIETSLDKENLEFDNFQVTPELYNRTHILADMPVLLVCVAFPSENARYAWLDKNHPHGHRGFRILNQSEVETIFSEV